MESSQKFKHLPYFNKLNSELKSNTQAQSTENVIDNQYNQDTPNKTELASKIAKERILETLKEAQKLISEFGQPDFAQTFVDISQTTEIEGGSNREVKIFITVYNENIWEKLVDGELGLVDMPPSCIDLEIKERYLIMKPTSLLYSNKGIKLFIALGLTNRIIQAREKPVKLYFNHPSLGFVKFKIEDYVPVYTDLEYSL